MGNVLMNASRVVFNIVLPLITNTFGALGNIFALLGYFVGDREIIRGRRRPVPMARYEQQSHYFGSVRLTRYETLNDTTIYVTFYNDHFEELIKAILYQRNELGARTECYIYNQDEGNGLLEGIEISPPISVSFLDTLFNYHDN